MTPFDTYKQYLAFKNHFTKEKYDYHKYGGASRAKVESFYKRKDRYFFEKTSRKYKDEEVCDFFLANFVATDNPQGVWIGNIIKTGEVVYKDWMKRQQSLFYNFKQGSEDMMDQYDYEEFFDASKGHPPILKSYLGGETSLETLVICDRIFEYGKNFDKKLDDPVWQSVSKRIKKYEPFLNINVLKFKKILQEIVL